MSHCELIIFDSVTELVIEIDISMQHEEHSEENMLHNIQKVVATSNTA